MPLLEYSSDRWKALRQQCFDRDGQRCVLCNAPEPLECHHRTYQRAGEERLSDLTTLCASCHLVVTDHQRRTRFAQRVLPAMQNTLVSPYSTKVFTGHSSYKEVSIETNTTVRLDGRRPAYDALWTTRRPLEPLE